MTDIPSVQWVHLKEGRKPEQEQSESVCKKMFRNIKGIIFDFDGTLFDNSRIAFHVIADNPIATIRVWRERLVRSGFAGRDFLTAQNYYRAFFTELGKACHLPAERLRAWYFNFYMPRLIRVLRKFYKPRPGLHELLAHMDTPNSPIKAAIYSDYPVLEQRMEALGLPPLEHINFYGPDTFGAQKPAARPFLQIAKNMGVSPEEVLVVGDREETDGLGALNAGMRFFCLETGRKRYFRMDPYRRKRDMPQGTTLLMYAGKWEGLINLLEERLS
ncbi:MAG: HAD family hydrolase [Treponema sp.]|nr:HAD family hydrolase [Treponema sp.]